MKNSIIFYILLLGGVFGGIQWTANSLFEKKKARLDKVNLHELVTGMLMVSQHPVATQLKGKDIILFHCELTSSDLTKLNAFAAAHPNKQIIFASYQPEKQMTENLKKENVSLTVPQVYEAEWLQQVNEQVKEVYGDGGSKNPFNVGTEVTAIDANGKVIMYTSGKNEDLFKEMDTKLK